MGGYVKSDGNLLIALASTVWLITPATLHELLIPALLTLRPMTSDSPSIPQRSRVAASALNAVLTRSLALDAAAPALLKALGPSSLKLTLIGPEISLRIDANGSELVVRGATDDVGADVHLRATPAAFIAFALGHGRSGALAIDGDALTAQRFERLFSQLRPDFGEALHGFVGERAAGLIARNLGPALAAIRDFAQTRRADVVSYLRDEARLAVGRPEFALHVEALDDARERLDRLAVRIQRRTSKT